VDLVKAKIDEEKVKGDGAIRKTIAFAYFVEGQ
jgi:hypothetical protein